MVKLILGLMNWLNAQAGWVLLAGVGLAGLAHWRQWRRDARQVSKLGEATQGKPPEARLKQAPKVSVLIPAWNEARHLPGCLDSILRLRYENKEVVVCAGGGDGTLEIAKGYAGEGVTILEQQRGEGKQRALQRCFEASTGEVIYLTDGDCILNDAVFESTLLPVLAEGEAAATGTWQPWEEIQQNKLVQFQWSQHLYREAWLPDSPRSLDGRNAAIRREAILRAKAFEAEAPTGTDYVQSRRLEAAGYRIRLVRGSRVETEYPETVRGYWRQLSRWVRTAMIQGRVWGDEAMVRLSWRSGLLALAFLGLTLAAPFSRFGLAVWVSGLAHLSLAQWRVSEAARRTLGGEVEFRSLQVCLPVGWVGLAWGLLESLSPERRGKW